jgi:hypothetical protein
VVGRRGLEPRTSALIPGLCCASNGRRAQFRVGLSSALANRILAESAVLELRLKLTAKQALDECHRRGLVVRSERELARRSGSHHWHLRMPGHTGTLELSEWENRVWVKVHPQRDGGWATTLAHELSARGGG